MSNPITSAQFRRLLTTELRECSEGGIAEIPALRSQFYRELPSDSAWEEFFSVGAVPDIPEFSGTLTYLSVSPGYHYKIEPKEFAGGLQWERKFLDDKKYPVLSAGATGLGQSSARVMEKYGVRPWAYAFSSTFDFMTSEEGVSMCSSSHTTKSGTSTSSGFDNSGTSALSKTSIAATALLMKGFRNDISERISINPDTIIVPDNLYDSACEAVGYMPETGASSQLDPESGANTINTQYRRFKVIAYPRLDDYDTNNWFMTDSNLMKKFMLWITRIAPDFNTTFDFETFYTKHSVYLRIGNGFIDWRHVYGHTVT